MRQVILFWRRTLSGNEVTIRKFICLVAFAGLTACGGGATEGIATQQEGDVACSINDQKQTVLVGLYDWYLWNDLLPADINIADYSSPEELVFRVTTELGPKDANGDPIDYFSSVGSAEADAQFFGEGKFEGFGFSWRFVDQAQTDFRIIRTFADSPADLGGLGRGQQVLSLNSRAVAVIQANEGIDAFFDANASVDFEVQPVVGAAFQTGDITQAVVTIPPIPLWKVIDAGNSRNVGYMELSTFISTADPEFDEVFQAFRNANVNDVILDLRYNGGGLVSTADLLGDYLGGFVAQNLIFSSTEFNADRAAQYNKTELLELRANSINLSRLVIIASRGTASASELVTNGMIPHVDVAIVGDRTFGKPVGQIGLTFCDKILRPTAFRLANALGDGDYFDGLPVDCPAADDLNVAVGDPLDPNMLAAMAYLDTGACPVVSVPLGSQFKATGQDRAPEPQRPGAPHRELLDAY
jgi:carboxyl-terminal processing protease